MLYKVTPAMRPVRGVPGARKRRPTAIYDAEGHEVLISLSCLKCRQLKPLARFGLRRMPDGAVRNQPWCRSCRRAAPRKRAAEDASLPLTFTGPSEPALAAAPGAP